MLYIRLMILQKYMYAWMYLPTHLTCTWHECIYQHFLHVPDMNVFINTSYMYLTWMYLPTHLFMYLTWMYLPAHLTCTWHECIYQHILHVPDMNVFTNTSYMYLTWMYLPTHLTCTWHECIYQHILHVPDMNVFGKYIHVRYM
jgi:hypothetical protein